MKTNKKKLKIDTPKGPQEYEGWKVGQKVWCHMYPNGEVATGKITAINLNSELPCFTFASLGEFSGLRMALFTAIIPVPTAAQQSKVNRFIAREAANEKKKLGK